MSPSRAKVTPHLQSRSCSSNKVTTLSVGRIIQKEIYDRLPITMRHDLIVHSLDTAMHVRVVVLSGCMEYLLLI